MTTATSESPLGNIHFGFGTKTIAFDAKEGIDAMVRDAGIRDYAGCNILARELLKVKCPEQFKNMSEEELSKWALGGMSRELAQYLNSFMTNEPTREVVEVIETPLIEEA
ncbi:hypothetical protein AVT69_gp028 [Pseudomonas phage PhiPA3]|uniref:Uncharacterized protein 027 n=1 Tax=Pseudomonas phage PhiPA3 TaxID=998086 RepID=F8SJQ9_BPPA3|nr:hypothetical protein AVT69_gp028 [Pseudomonas phage PhiPA3]AEH03454.1 hypothetical protein [Pseudomonas phage PhiPA3]